MMGRGRRPNGVSLLRGPPFPTSFLLAKPNAPSRPPPRYAVRPPELARLRRSRPPRAATTAVGVAGRVGPARRPVARGRVDFLWAIGRASQLSLRRRHARRGPRGRSPSGRSRGAPAGSSGRPPRGLCSAVAIAAGRRGGRVAKGRRGVPRRRENSPRRHEPALSPRQRGRPGPLRPAPVRAAGAARRAHVTREGRALRRA
jgi:hypothetical protein